jgi:hypothetical protein
MDFDEAASRAGLDTKTFNQVVQICHASPIEYPQVLPSDGFAILGESQSNDSKEAGELSDEEEFRRRVALKRARQKLLSSATPEAGKGVKPTAPPGLSSGAYQNILHGVCFEFPGENLDSLAVRAIKLRTVLNGRSQVFLCNYSGKNTILVTPSEKQLVLAQQLLPREYKPEEWNAVLKLTKELEASPNVYFLGGDANTLFFQTRQEHAKSCSANILKTLRQFDNEHGSILATQSLESELQKFEKTGVLSLLLK